MKKLFFFFSCMLIIMIGSAQQLTTDNVPQPVKTAFEKMFPGVTDIRYEKENKDFEVTFRNNRIEYSAVFDAAGSWLETETILELADLPQGIAVDMKKNFSGFQLKEAVKVEKQGKELCYELELLKGKEGYKVLYDKTGKMFKKEILKPENK